MAVKQHLRISAHIYSGMEDPVWEVNYSDPDFDDLVALVKQHPSGELPSILGYKGFSVKHIVGGQVQSCVNVGQGTNIQLETKLLDTMKEPGLQTHVPLVKQALGI